MCRPRRGLFFGPVPDPGLTSQATIFVVPRTPENRFSSTSRYVNDPAIVRLGYSKDSGWMFKSPSPVVFFSQYLRTQASQLLPAAVSRPVKASAAMSE